MDILFTSNEKFWSRAFRFLSKEPVSHLAFRFNINEFTFTIDCSTVGCRLMTWDKFKTLNNSIHEVILETDPELESLLFGRCLKLVGYPYDMGAYKYGIYRGLLRLLFKLPIPKINRWSSPGEFACTEIFVPIKDILHQEYLISFYEINLDMTSPYEIFKILSEGNSNGLLSSDRGV